MVRNFTLNTQFTDANLSTAAGNTQDSVDMLELAKAQAAAADAIIEARRIAQEALDADTAAQKIAANKLAKEAADRAAALQKIANDKKIEADRLAAEAVAKAGTAADAATTAATSDAKGAAAAATLAAKQGELKTLQDKQAADWAEQQRIEAAKAVADKIAAEKAAADKAAADKIAADKVIADKLAAAEATLKAALAAGDLERQKAAQAAIEAAKAAAAQKAQYDKFLADQIEASKKTLLEQTAASKLAYDTAAADKAEVLQVERTSAFNILKTEFDKYGLESLADTVKNLILNGTPVAEATLKLRDTSAYKLRFAGNTTRLTEGKNLYDEGTYLGLENDFAESFAAYGQNALLGPTRESAQAKFAEYIGMDKSPVEIKNRIKLAVDEVNARPEILKTFNEYFPSLDETDLVSYFLDPKDTLSRLETKVQTAQIGAAASRQGLQAYAPASLELAQLGLTEEQANVGYQKVARDLPTMEKLGQISNTPVNQTTAEGAYLKGLASEQRKIDKLAEEEQMRFTGSSGNTKGSLSNPKI